MHNVNTLGEDVGVCGSACTWLQNHKKHKSTQTQSLNVSVVHMQRELLLILIRSAVCVCVCGQKYIRVGELTGCTKVKEDEKTVATTPEQPLSTWYCMLKVISSELYRQVHCRYYYMQQFISWRIGLDETKGLKYFNWNTQKFKCSSEEHCGLWSKDFSPFFLSCQFSWLHLIRKESNTLMWCSLTGYQVKLSQQLEADQLQLSQQVSDWLKSFNGQRLCFNVQVLLFV